jgi:hypothetical protein
LQEGSGVAAAATAATTATGRKRTATGADTTPHRPVRTQPHLRKQCTALITSQVSKLQQIVDLTADSDNEDTPVPKPQTKPNMVKPILFNLTAYEDVASSSFKSTCGTGTFLTAFSLTSVSLALASF